MPGAGTAVDAHIHTSFSHDASGDYSDYCEKACESGYQVLCFTEHLDLNPADPYSGLFDYTAARDRFESAADAFRGRLQLMFGVEVSYERSIDQLIREYLAVPGRRFDYLLGSVHMADGVLFTMEEPALDRYRDFPPEEAYGPYFRELKYTAACGIFDAVAHPDVVRRFGELAYGRLDPGLYRRLAAPTLFEAAQRGIALEINSSGLREAPGSCYPSFDILQAFYSLGGRVVVLGSDSHEPASLGAGIDTAAISAKKAGFRDTVVFRERTMVSVGRL